MAEKDVINLPKRLFAVNLATAVLLAGSGCTFHYLLYKKRSDTNYKFWVAFNDNLYNKKQNNRWMEAAYQSYIESDAPEAKIVQNNRDTLVKAQSGVIIGVILGFVIGYTSLGSPAFPRLFAGAATASLFSGASGYGMYQWKSSKYSVSESMQANAAFTAYMREKMLKMKQPSQPSPTPASEQPNIPPASS